MHNSEKNNSIGMKIQRDLSSFLYEALEFFSKYSFLGEYENALRKLAETATRPFNVAVFGRMKTGKSTLINALIGKSLAITGVEETTATINVISYSKDEDMLNKFKVHWKDSPAQLFPLEKLQEDYSGKEEDVLTRVARTKYLQLYSKDENLALHEIIDTPGTGSATDEHEKIAKDFIDASTNEGRNADALVYVFSPIGRESDLQSLDAFSAGCLPSSEPYNSVAVLHKWDDLYWDNGGDFTEVERKVERLYSNIKDKVSKVIPVSGPLALAGYNAPDSFFKNIMNFKIDEITPALRRDEKWDRDPTRLVLRKSYPMPWSSFQVLVREVSSGKYSNTQEARHAIIELSGIQKLKDFLDKNFFKNGAIIRLRQTLAKLNLIKAKSYLKIEQELSSLKEDSKYWNDAIKNLPSNLKSWAENKAYKNINTIKNIEERYGYLDKMFINSEIPLIIKDIDAVTWASSKLSQEEFLLIKEIVAFFIDNKKISVSIEELDALNKKLFALENSPFAKDRESSDHLVERIYKFKKTGL